MSNWDREPTDPCAECGAPDIGWFSVLYRKKERRNNRPDPGNLCGKCAGSRDGKRISEEILSEERTQISDKEHKRIAHLTRPEQIHPVSGPKPRAPTLDTLS